MLTHDYQMLVCGPAYRQATRRVLRQLLEALLFEQALPHCEWSADRVQFAARSADASPVQYHCTATRAFGFDRVRITGPLLRVHAETTTEATDPALFLAEIAPWLQADDTRLGQFAAELLATQIKDAQSLHARGGQVLRDADYDMIEAQLTDAHPYHPSYKSRVGFTLDDNSAYAPEAARAVSPVLLAARADCCRWAASGEPDTESAARMLLGEAAAARFADALRERGLQPGSYLPLPVHPWQWDEVFTLGYHQAAARNEVVALHTMTQAYLPQQSIRTLANVADPRRLSLKLSMSLVNTSTSRVLAPHTVCNAPVISDWLHALVERTDWSAPLVRPVLLREVAGVSFTPAAPAAGQYGALSCIWRESIHGHLRPGERAVPMTAVLHIDADGRPFIDAWVRRHGAAVWLARLIERAWLPVLQLLWEHGTALESHAQNMILLCDDTGLPARVALKDFHDGVRFSKALLAHPAPALTPPPAEHARINPNSFLETDSADELRDFTFDALFFVNLAELAWIFERHHDMPEPRFWSITRDVLRAHQRRCPQRADRFALFDCFADEVAIELLASRRFRPEVRLRTRPARNPLAPLDPSTCT